MNKKIIIIMIIVVFIIVSFSGVYSWQKKESSISSTITTSSIPQIDSYTMENNFSILEKNQLYTEEGGKYANLNEIGKKLLRNALMRPECTNNPNEAYCGNEYMIINSSIIAMNNEYALFKFPSFKGGSVYKVYNLINKEFVDKNPGLFSPIIKTKEIIFFVEIGELFKYKIGDSSFSIVKNSKLKKDETYYKSSGLGYKEIESTLEESILKISIFSVFKDEPNKTPKKLREVVFNLDSF